ncbi:MAG TPA: hypothetical protein PKJ55_13015, partial [Novosphingobium sp.]|nr:hypothetical protein [Novosphingobium sp.]
MRIHVVAAGHVLSPELRPCRAFAPALSPAAARLKGIAAHYGQFTALIASLPPIAIPGATELGAKRLVMAEIEQRLLMLIDDEPAQSRLITAL